MTDSEIIEELETYKERLAGVIELVKQNDYDHATDLLKSVISPNSSVDATIRSVAVPQGFPIERMTTLDDVLYGIIDQDNHLSNRES